MLLKLRCVLHRPYSIRRMMLKRLLCYDLLFLSVGEDSAMHSFIGVNNVLDGEEECDYWR